MPHSLSEVNTLINDISTNLNSCFTELSAKGVTVPADSSLEDLGGLIRQIPDASRPDYDIPWIMCDGSSAIWLPVTTQKTRSVFLSAELVPVDSEVYLAGCRDQTTGLQLGLCQMQYGLRSRRRLVTTSYTSDTNNYVGQNSQWSDSSYPYHKVSRMATSYVNNTNCRASLLWDGTWQHAGSGMVQASDSFAQDSPLGIFACPISSNTGLTFPYQIAPRGTIIYDISIGTSSYSGTPTDNYRPVLHWDSRTSKYRPCFARDNGSAIIYSTFPKNAKLDYIDGDAYYIDVLSGLSQLNAPPRGFEFKTAIPHEAGNVYVMRVKADGSNDNVNESVLTNYFDGGTGDIFDIYYRCNINSGTYTQRINVNYAGTGVNLAIMTGSSVQQMDYIISVAADSGNSGETFSTPYDPLMTPKTAKTITYGTPGGYLRILDYIVWLKVYNNGVLTHYIVPCDIDGNDTVLYDCVERNIIQHE